MEGSYVHFYQLLTFAYFVTLLTQCPFLLFQFHQPKEWIT